MRKWEYRVVELPGLVGEIEEELNSLGDTGWELVGFYRHGSRPGRFAILKRPAPGLPQC